MYFTQHNPPPPPNLFAFVLYDPTPDPFLGFNLEPTSDP